MITLKQFFEVTNYRITEGDNYGWSCYGPNAYSLDSWNGEYGDGDGPGRSSFSIVFSTKSQKVYEVSMCDYTNNRAYRMINPDYVKKHAKEAKARDVNLNEAWEDIDYVDLDVEADWIEKAKAIVSGQPYDTRVQIEVRFLDEELLQYMKLAHERDMTFNDFVEETLRHAIESDKQLEFNKL
jgi:hypothetical protein